MLSKKQKVPDFSLNQLSQRTLVELLNKETIALDSLKQIAFKCFIKIKKTSK